MVQALSSKQLPRKQIRNIGSVPGNESQRGGRGPFSFKEDKSTHQTETETRVLYSYSCNVAPSAKIDFRRFEYVVVVVWLLLPYSSRLCQRFAGDVASSTLFVLRGLGPLTLHRVTSYHVVVEYWASRPSYT